MKIFLYLIILSHNAYAAQLEFKKIDCTEQDLSLSIYQVLSDTIEEVQLQWHVQDILNSEILITGQGILHKEADSSDAFSAFDEKTAISFKNNRAVFVLPNGQAILFPTCK